MKKILMASSQHWDSPFHVGSHHLAKRFAMAGWQVLYLSDPLSPLHLLGRNTDDLKPRFQSYLRGGNKDAASKVFSYVPLSLLTPHNKPLLDRDWVQFNWHRLSVPNIMSYLARTGFDQVDLLYLDSINFSFLIDHVSHRKSILRIADAYSSFSKYTKAAAKAESYLAQNVDCVIYTAKHLLNYVLQLKPKNVLHVPNGVNFAHFANRNGTMPSDLKTIPGPIAVYVGAMEEWFDFELINKAALALPEVSFVLIGPDHLAKRRLSKYPNLHILGKKGYSDLPNYLAHCDVGLIPFDVLNHGNLVHGINPLKLYEYLACGIPVVSSDWSEMHQLNPPATLCNTVDEFISGIRVALADPANKQARIEYAAREDWGHRVNLITDNLFR